MKQLLFLCIISILWQANVQAQEGYPLDGTWRGQWQQASGEQAMAVIVMNWDGETINGRINPGRNMIFFEEASLDPENWMVRFSSTSREGESIEFEGALENIGSYNRTISGTWVIGDVSTVLVLTRE